MPEYVEPRVYETHVRVNEALTTADVVSHRMESLRTTNEKKFSWVEDLNTKMLARHGNPEQWCVLGQSGIYTGDEIKIPSLVYFRIGRMSKL